MRRKSGFQYCSIAKTGNLLIRNQTEQSQSPYRNRNKPNPNLRDDDETLCPRITSTRRRRPQIQTTSTDIPGQRASALPQNALLPPQPRKTLRHLLRRLLLVAPVPKSRLLRPHLRGRPSARAGTRRILPTAAFVSSRGAASSFVGRVGARVVRRGPHGEPSGVGVDGFAVEQRDERGYFDREDLSGDYGGSERGYFDAECQGYEE